MDPTNDYAQVPVSTLSSGEAEKMLGIQIGADDLQTLKANGYNLCFAKSVFNGSAPFYNVVWCAASDYLMSNSFRYTAEFELFGTNRFQPDVTVEVMTNITTIGLGEEAVLDASGVLSEPMTGGPDTGITLINQYGPICPGLCQLFTSPDGQTVSCPTFVNENAMMMGQATLTPIDKVLVWFQQNVQTSTMFTGQPSMSIEADLTDVNILTLTYVNGQWSIG